MPRRRTFYDVLTEAVADITDHGFDSSERVARWAEELRQSAEAAMTPRTVMEQMLREAMVTIYKRLIDKGGIVAHNPGVSRYTINHVKPELRAELARRIMASADLIKLNRERAIAQTIERFQGWAISVPRGGTDAANKPKIKKEVRKALASLPFNERRVLTDQGHKFIAALSEIVAMDGGAIAGIWHSHWRQANYNYREDHKLRDGKIYMIRDNWAQKAGLVKPGKVGYYDDVTAVGQEVFCRCWMQWIHNLGSLPATMLTDKGKVRLREARAKVKAA